MLNNDRFFQDIDSLVPASEDYSHITNGEEREFLDLGSTIQLKGNRYGDVTIVDRLVNYNGVLYDYKGQYDAADGTKHSLCFNESSIEDVKTGERHR